MYIQIAWRNIWRNPRRTAVIMTAIIIGIWSMIFLGSIMRGMEYNMIKNGISTLTGNIQIHQKDYRNDPTIENSMSDPIYLETVLTDVLPEVVKWTSRIRVNAIASNARHSSGITLVGINPIKEGRVSFIEQSINNGNYLDPENMQGIVIGQALLEKFETKIGHKLILMSQDTDGEIASRSFRIIGTFRSELQATEKQFVFITITAARQMLKLSKGISEISIVLDDNIDEDHLADRLKAKLDANEYQVETWQDILPILKAYMELSNGFILIWFIVVFIAMGFGIVNTTLMAVFERMREFGLLKALGMKPWWIIRDVLLESFLLLVIGISIGNILSFISIFALSQFGINLSAFAAGAEFSGISRIIYPEFFIKDAVLSNMVVFILGLLVSLYPAVRAARFSPVEALTHT